jgi:hypothetical protein
MCILSVNGKPVSGPLPWPRATALARSFVRHWGINPANVAFTGA